VKQAARFSGTEDTVQEYLDRLPGFGF
jgi:hypothetical protein